jgi:hypothetical protein
MNQGTQGRDPWQAVAEGTSALPKLSSSSSELADAGARSCWRRYFNNRVGKRWSSCMVNQAFSAARARGSVGGWVRGQDR